MKIKIFYNHKRGYWMQLFNDFFLLIRKKIIFKMREKYE